MNKAAKKIIGAIMTCSMVLLCVSSVFAKNIDIREYSKNSSYIESLNGNLDIKTSKETKVAHEKTGSVTKTKVNVNAQKIKDSKGKISLISEDDTEYKDIDATVMTDVDITVNVPIIYGKKDDVELEIKDGSETTYYGVKAPYVYKYDYNYNKPVYVDLP